MSHHVKGQNVFCHVKCNFLKGDNLKHHYLQKVSDVNPSKEVFCDRAEEADNARDIM